MLNNPTTEKLLSMKLAGMVKALQQQEEVPELQKLTFHERLGLLVDQEFSEQENVKFTNRLKFAKLRQQACIEDINFQHSRGLDKLLVGQLASGQWIKEALNVLITGPTGVGKSYIACALAHKACRLGFSALYYRSPRFFQDLMLSRMNGGYSRLLTKISKVDLLVLDDFALAPITEENSRDLLEVADDRCNVHSVIVVSQLPVEHWYQTIPNATIADAILDRVVHSAYRIGLQGESLRKKNKKVITQKVSKDS